MGKFRLVSFGFSAIKTIISSMVVSITRVLLASKSSCSLFSRAQHMANSAISVVVS